MKFVFPLFLMLVALLSAGPLLRDIQSRRATESGTQPVKTVASAKDSPRVSSLNVDQKIEMLLPALRFRESTNGLNRIGDKTDEKGRPRPPSEWAYGILQIRRLCLDDYNNAHKTAHTLQDLTYNDELSTTICRWYLKHYTKPSRLGREPTLEDLARIWNGGPNGYKKRSTDEYWADISGLLFGHENAYAVRR